MLGEGKQFTFSQVPIDLNYNYSPGDNQRGDGECVPGSSRETPPSHSQRDCTNPGFGGWDFLWRVDCLSHQPCGRRIPPNAKSIIGEASQPTEKLQVHRRRGWGCSAAPEARPAQRQDRPKALQWRSLEPSVSNFLAIVNLSSKLHIIYT